jgi:hypothetical protein
MIIWLDGMPWSFASEAALVRVLWWHLHRKGRR